LPAENARGVWQDGEKQDHAAKTQAVPGGTIIEAQTFVLLGVLVAFPVPARADHGRAQPGVLRTSACRIGSL